MFVLKFFAVVSSVVGMPTVAEIPDAVSIPVAAGVLMILVGQYL
jgi:hypothetical protein